MTRYRVSTASDPTFTHSKVQLFNSLFEMLQWFKYADLHQYDFVQVEHSPFGHGRWAIMDAGRWTTPSTQHTTTKETTTDGIR